MRADQERIRKFLDLGEFWELFNYLGWDNPEHEPFQSREDGKWVTQMAQKRGVGVWRVDEIPPSAVRRRIDRDVSRHTRERLLIFKGEDRQLWLWPETRPSGSGHHLVTHEYHMETRNEALVQRLATVGFSLEEEGSLTVMDVLHRVRGQFKADKVTKQFYKEFRQNHVRLTDFIEGIEQEKDKEWYSTVLLNRLMFIYFMQKKGFMEDDPDYLRNRLKMVRKYLGKDSFYGFFREFLLPLFHEGLGSHQHLYDDPAIAEIIGNIPYVNGAIFDPHSLEEHHHINIRDREFERIFDFFDQYRWHLDERPTLEPNEINPDVLGYVFEQLVNQKEQGAYYTKEDITGYMTSVTVIPALLDRLEVDDDPMDLLTADPERYIHESVSYGLKEELQEDIAAGVADPAKIVDEDWFEKAPPRIGLPGETWWETIDRHRHYRDLRERVTAGEIKTVNDAITANLDLRTLITDFLGMLTPIESVEKAYRTLQELTVLDPTCGSGAFLFAALDILADCYKTLLERAEELSIGDTTPDILQEADEHPNRMYFIYKQVMLNNLYGVDIMPEAGEIARLRMFLKLAAQLTEAHKIEPLPDLDFNIKTGNLLVGIAHQKDAEIRLDDMFGRDKLEEIRRDSVPLSEKITRFSQVQQRNDHSTYKKLKIEIKNEKNRLRNLLDIHLYKIRTEKKDIKSWSKSHQPFHWFAEFPNVFLEKGGFDIIIGNPPYIRRTKITNYRWQGYETQKSPDIYALCIERSLNLLTSASRFTMIIPTSLQFSHRYKKSREIVSEFLPQRWISTYDNGPDRLFQDVDQRVVILVGSSNTDAIKTLATTKFSRWTKKYRNYLFENLRYTTIPALNRTMIGWPKFGSPAEMNILDTLLSHTTIAELTVRGEFPLYYKNATRYYISTFLKIPPAYNKFNKEVQQSQVKYITFSDARLRDYIFMFSLSKLFLLWWAIQGDGFHITQTDITSAPIFYQKEMVDQIIQQCPSLEAIYNDTLSFTKNAGKYYGNYDARQIRHLTDKVDQLILSEIGLEDHWPALQLFYAWFTKQATDT